MKRSLFAVALLAPVALTAQVVEPPPPAEPTPPPSSQPPPSNNGGDQESEFLGKDVPFFDPSTETITWDGKTWNVTNNRVFRARFEKYLNAPEESGQQDVEYNAILARILDLLNPLKVNPKNLDEAFALLPKASEFRRDAGLCDTIANQVLAAWQAQRARNRLQAATSALEEERARLERNKRIALETARFSVRARPADGNTFSADQRREQALLDATTNPIDQRLIEVNTLIKTNEAKRELRELQAKIEFQSLIIQLFLQRRFEHVLIATRFYRHVFNDGNQELQVKGASKDLFEHSTGMPPTVSTLDALANEMIRDVAEGVDAFEYLLERDELESATKRLSEAFLIGEYMPSIRTLPRETKRRALAFAQKSNQLVSALEVKDYERAENLVNELEKTAKDFDNSKPMAAIQTAKTIAAMHIAKARNAAVGGDRVTLEAELAAATAIWPRNPELRDVSTMIFSQGNEQNKAQVDFDQLLSQKNYRQIFDDKERFIAAMAFDPERQDQLRQVLADMTKIESAIIRAQEIEKRGDFAGAWESAETAFQAYPMDPKLNQLRANLTTKAADFVRALRRAEELEQNGQIGSSLAWFLKAQQEYPNSEFARKGIERLTNEILPDAT